jgi:hypothetical protein
MRNKNFYKTLTRPGFLCDERLGELAKSDFLNGIFETNILRKIYGPIQ